MKVITSIRFENGFDEESKKMYETFSEEKVNDFVEMWKVEIEKTIRNEVDSNITFFEIDMKIINE